MQVESTKKSPGIFSGSRSAGLAMPNEVSTTCVSGWAIRLTRGCVLEYDEPASVGVQVDMRIITYGSRTSCLPACAHAWPGPSFRWLCQLRCVGVKLGA